MKTRNYIIILVLTFVSTFSQTQGYSQINGINYQAVAIDENGKEIVGMNINGVAIKNKAISVRFSILLGSAEGSLVYQETHTTNTDPHGLFSLVIGQGSVTSQSTASTLYDIKWSSQNYWLKVEVDYRQTNDYKVMGVQQLLAVPFAFYSLSSGNQAQSLQLNGNELSISNGNAITLPSVNYVAGNGISITGNKISNTQPNNYQVLSISNDTIYLTNGGFVKLPANFSGNYNDLSNKPTIAPAAVTGSYTDLTNKPTIPTKTSDLANDAGYLTSFSESQILSIRNDTVYLTGGSFVKLPATFSGNYNDLRNKPTIASSAISGSYADLTDKPKIPTKTSELSNDAGYLTSFSESQILSISNDTVYLTGGSFVKLPASFSGNYNDLSNKPTIAPAAVTGSYTDLTDKPIIPTKTSDLANDAGFLTSFSESQILSISNDTIYLTGSSFVKLPASFSGNYNDLNNKPTVPTKTGDLINDVGFITAETQTLSVSNDSLFISKGNGVPLNSIIPQSSSGVKILEVDGTFLVPSNVTSIIVEIWGAGGGGGNGGDGRCGSCGFSTSGGGGGAGGYKKVFMSVSPGQSITYTIGKGGLPQNPGTSTIFSSNTATGGSAGGDGSGPYTTCSGANFGAVGIAGTGGNNGERGCCNINFGCNGGNGGDAAVGLGTGGIGGITQTSARINGNEGLDGGRASGGGGGSGVLSGAGLCPDCGTTGGVGGKGGDGLIIVYW